MEIDELVSALAPSRADAAQTPKRSEGLGQQDFLRMLIAQLENQDPLNPQDATEFTAQLATFSSLEQLLSIRTGIDKLSGAQSDSKRLDAASLVGREVMARSEQFAFDPASASLPQLSFSLPGASTATRVEILGPTGNAVRTLELGPLAQGRHDVPWDGTGANGAPLAKGTYGIRVTGTAGGQEVAGETFVRGVVGGALVSGESPVLLLGDVPVPLASVEEVRAVGARP